MTKRKISYEQDVALARGRKVARANQRRRVAANQADAAAAERERLAASHVHGWRNWEYDFDAGTETRECRDCHATETRLLSDGTFRGVFDS